MRGKTKNIESLINDVLSGKYKKFKDLIYILQNDKDVLSKSEARVGILFVVLVEDFDWDKETSEEVFVFYKELVKAINQRFEEWNYPADYKIPEKWPAFPRVIGIVLGELSKISLQVCKIPISCVVVNKKREPGPGFFTQIKKFNNFLQQNIKNQISNWQAETRKLFRELRLFLKEPFFS